MEEIFNVQVSNHIPDDIVFSILSKLSLKSFKRFECVRKSWSLLFDNPYFITMYRNHLLTKYCSYYDDHHTTLLLHMIQVPEDEDEQLWNGIGDVFYSLSGDKFDDIVQIDGPKAIKFDDFLEYGDHHYDDEEEDGDDNGFDILYPISYNGTLNLRRDDFYGKENVILWNLIGDDFMAIPSHENSHLWDFSAHHYQIGYDRVKDDYKIIRCTHYYPKDVSSSCGMSSGHFWEMYSLSSNSWKKIDVEMPHSRWSREQVYMDGVFHWWDKNETHTCLVSFDFCKESFIVTPIPVDDSFDSNLVRRHLMVLNGSIAFMLNYTEASIFHISILGELGIKESWTKLFIIGPLPCLEYPIGAGKKGNILFRKKDGELAWFDLSTGMIVDIGVKTQTNDYKMLFHKESLPIEGIYTNFSSCFHPRDL
ncbi:F-box only protein 8-like [Trifolium pratense]|uniref:F-box only protein 8-like n=1 Tax=Trifolium pratense TaxID=57577 RepID=UPI001E6914CA|nr:F-box only protein 8-like [Trifolium pratense]